MTLLKQTIQSDYKNLTTKATIALNIHHNELKSQFSDESVFFTKYSVKGENKEVAEIRLENERATLTCHFDEDNKCNEVYLFLDHDADLTEYIQYANQTYEYSYLWNQWKVSNGNMTILKSGNISSIKIFR